MERKARLQSVVIEDGINSNEAEILSSEYFSRYISGYGMAGEPIDAGDKWESVAYVGYAGTPLEDKIEVEKKSGTISLKGKPTIKDPIKEWGVGP